MCVFRRVLHLVKLPMFRHILRSSPYPRRSLSIDSRLELICRVGGVYHEVNGELLGFQPRGRQSYPGIAIQWDTNSYDDIYPK